MCFIMSIVLLALSFNFFNAGSTLLAVGSLMGAGFFIYLMIKNIRYVKNLKNKENKQ